MSSEDQSLELSRAAKSLGRNLAAAGSRLTGNTMLESAIAGLVTGLASILPATILALLQKPNWSVLISMTIACGAVGFGMHGFVYGRRNALHAAKMAAQVARSTATLRPSRPHQDDEADLAATVFHVLWNRADPGKPMDPLRLAHAIADHAPDVLADRNRDDIVRSVERIRRLGELPPLVRNREGFFLDSDDLHFKLNMAVEHKRQIAETAAAYVRPGMSIAFDGGSTTLQVARILSSRIAASTLFQLRITTSSIQVCSELLGVPECREAIRDGELSVWSMAGPLHPSCWTMDPPNTEDCPWPLDLAIIGANGIQPDGFYLPNEHGYWVKKTLLRLAPRTLIVADSTKLGKQLPVRFAPWSESITLITNRPDDAAARRILQTLPKHSVVYSAPRSAEKS
ncbi:MAG TPA: hypothetical protein VE465_07905 [Streptosporangiaceae bacterium]|nr:hypothetical protein [Streptosporangiaceae bacterium]